MVFAPVALWGGFAWNNNHIAGRSFPGVGCSISSSSSNCQRFVAAARTGALASAKKASTFSSDDEPSSSSSSSAPSLLIRDVIDEEAAMTSFFSTREEWSSTFRLLAGESLPKHTSALLDDVLGHIGAKKDPPPWQQYQGIPQDVEDRAVLETFLNSMHQALLDIPVTDSYVGQGEPLENDNDRRFLEEGRRMLAVSRYHVLADNAGGSLAAVDALFTYCWSELRQLQGSGVAHTGSIILLPRYERGDLARFAEMNVARPLTWLGLEGAFEVANVHFGVPAIRMLCKLDDMPLVADVDDGSNNNNNL